MKSNLFNLSNTAFLAAAVLALTAAAVRADVEDRISKTFPVAPGGQLVVEVDRGAIEVHSADVRAVSIEITRKARGNRNSAERTLSNHVVTATQNDNKVEVRAEFKGAKRGGWFGRSPELQVNYVVTIPRKFDVNLKTAGGHIKVLGLTGEVEANTSGGHLEFYQITGPISGHTSGGHISVAGCKGTVDINTSGGHLDLREIEGDVTARTSGGSIHARKITGKTILKTSGGGIEVAGIKGSIEAGTSGGHIDTELLEQPIGDCSFKTSGGHITIVLGAKVAVDVNAATSAGRVSTDFPVVAVIQGEQKKNELRGKINGGGPLLTARTSGGNVRFEKK